MIGISQPIGENGYPAGVCIQVLQEPPDRVKSSPKSGNTAWGDRSRSLISGCFSGKVIEGIQIIILVEREGSKQRGILLKGNV